MPESKLQKFKDALAENSKPKNRKLQEGIRIAMRIVKQETNFEGREGLEKSSRTSSEKGCRAHGGEWPAILIPKAVKRKRSLLRDPRVGAGYK